MGFLDNMSSAAGGVLSAGVGFLGNLGGSIAGGLFSANQAKKNRAFQERMYNKQYQDSIDFWKMQNEYNLPSAQLERLRQANLNPLLMYGEGGISGNLAQQSPQLPQQPHGAQGQVSSFNTRIELANLALLKAQKENIEADSMLKTNEALKSVADKVKTYQDYDWAKETWELRKDQITAEINLKSALDMTETSKRNQIEVEIEKALAEVDFVKAEMENKNRLTDQEIKESDQRIQNSIKQTAAAVAEMEANARKAYADAAYAAAMAAIVGSPEYKRDSLKLKAEELRKAINEGNLSAIEAGLAAWMYDQRPREGSAGYEYRKWIDTWVTPVTESLGKVFGGSATYQFPTRRK